mmetsp:Transcript_18036/g.32119  ORF Transcript_18036/g.32119 Transcript_18036/m.32119 type:complete len:281 (+) Transcript_18036:52-894(+)
MYDDVGVLEAESQPRLHNTMLSPLKARSMLCCNYLLGVVGAGVESLWAGGDVQGESLLGVGGLRNGDQLLQQGLQVAQRPLGGAVHGGGGGVVVDLHKQTVNAVGDAGTSHAGDELTVAARGDATALQGAASGLLQRVGDVGDDGALGVAHPDEVTGVDDQVRVTYHGAALAHHDVGVARPTDLVGRVAHDRGGAHLALLDVHNLPGLGGGDDEVGLTAQEGGDLDNIGHLAHRLALPALVHVGHDGHAVGVLHLLQHPEALLHAGATEARGRGTVGLVE